MGTRSGLQLILPVLVVLYETTASLAVLIQHSFPFEFWTKTPTTQSLSFAHSAQQSSFEAASTLCPLDLLPAAAQSRSTTKLQVVGVRTAWRLSGRAYAAAFQDPSK